MIKICFKQQKMFVNKNTFYLLDSSAPPFTQMPKP